MYEQNHINNTLGFPMHFSCLGQMYSWSRPNIKFHESIATISDLAKYATWSAFEFGMLNVNIPDLGSPCGWKTTNQTEEELRMLIFPESRVKYELLEMERQMQGEEEERPRRAKKPKAKGDKKPDTGAESLFDFNFGAYRPDITKHIGQILHKAKTDVTDLCYNLKFNPKVLFSLKTTDMPSIPRPDVEMRADNEDFPDLLDNIDNPDLFRCQKKFDINIVQLPSPLYTEANSFVVVITPLDESYDPIQFIKYLDMAFKRAKDQKVESVHKLRNKNVTNGATKADVYGNNNPLAHDENITAGGFYNENQLDSIRARTGGADLATSIETSHGIKSASIADEEFGWLHMLTSYFKLSEMAAFDTHCQTLESQGISISPEVEASIQQTILLKTNELLFESTLNNDDRQKIEYESYRHGLNPRRLFTMENALNVIQYIDNVVKASSNIQHDTPSILSKFNLEFVRLSYPWTETNRGNLNTVAAIPLPEYLYDHKCFWADMPFKSSKSQFIQALTPKDGITCSIYKYDHILSRFCWLKKNGVTNSVEGLASEYFPWSKPIYTIPQSLLRYKQNVIALTKSTVQQTQEPVIRQRYQLPGHVANKKVEEITQEGYDEDFLNDFVNHHGKMVRKKTNDNVDGTKWSGVPFNPLTCIKSFVPSCKLPVVYSSVMLHQACLRYRHDAMYAARPTFTDLLYCMAADRQSDFVFSTSDGIVRLPLVKYAMGEIPWNYIKNMTSPSFIHPFNAYLEKHMNETQKALKIMNDFAKIKREYSWHTTHYFEDLFLNQANLGKFRTSDAFNRMSAYYIEETKPGKSTFIPSQYIKFILGSTSNLPQEELLGLHLNDIASKMSILHDTFGNQKLKIHITAWGGIILGHMDLSYPMMFHIFIAGEKALGKSRSKSKIEDFLIPGIVKDFAAMSDNSLMITGDRSGSVWTSEESIQALFDKLEFGDKVQLFKTLMSDGNLAKTLCNYDSGVRQLLTAIAFLRISMILCFNKHLELLNGPIRSRVHATTLGATYETDKTKNTKKRPREEEETPSKRQRREESGMEVDSALEESPKEIFGKLLAEKRKQYERAVIAKLSKVQSIMGSSSSTSDSVVIPEESPQESTQPVNDLQSNPFSSLETINYIYYDSREVDENFIIHHYKQHVDRIIKNTEEQKQDKNNQEDPDQRELNSYAALCTLLHQLDPQFNANEYREILKNTLKTDLDSMDGPKSRTEATNINLENTVFSTFETSSEVSECARISRAQDLFRDYVRVESMVSFFVQQAAMEGRLTVSKRLFWVLIPLFITYLKERCPFIHVDPRSITRMLILATNFTINKAFREEFMTPIDIWTGKPNPKYNIPFRHSFIQDLAPRLFLTTGAIVAGFTIVAEEIINPWMHDIFMAMFSKSTEFFQFYRALLSYEQYINKEHAEQWLSKPFKIFTTQKVELENSTLDRPMFETRHIMNIPTALTCENPKCGGDSFFKKASFLEYFDTACNKTVYDMNYVVLAQQSERAFPQSSDVKTLYIRTMRDLLTTDICTSANIRIGKEAVAGLVEKLFDEMITVQTVFDIVEKDVILSLFDRELEFVQTKTVPHFSVFQRTIEPKRVACLSIKIIQVSPSGEKKVFLLLSTHAMVKTLSDDVVIDSMKDFLKQTSNMESILTLGMTKAADILKNKKVDGLSGDVHSYIKTHLQQMHVGISPKLCVDEEKRTRKFVCVDGSKKSHHPSQSDSPHFYYNFINTELKGTWKNPTNPPVISPDMNSLAESVDDITFDDQESMEKEMEFTQQMKEMLEREIPKNIIIMHTDTDLWAAIMHLTSSHCSQLKLDFKHLNRANYMDFISECKREKLFYFHQKVPTSSRYTADQTNDYINAKENCGEWRPVSSLVPAKISKRYFKLRWQNKDNFIAFSAWKQTLLEFYNTHMVAPGPEITKKNTAHVFYSNKLGTFIPKYVLRDLYRYQTRLAERIKD